MKKYLLGVYVLLVFATPVLAQQLKWTEFKEPTLKFAVLFPAEPTKNDPQISKRNDGTVESTGYLFIAGVTNTFVSLAGATDYNFAVVAEAELTADRDNFVNALKLKVTNNRRYDFQAGDEKLPALAFTMDGDTMAGKAIVVVRGNRAYMAAFVYQKGQDYAAAVDKFLDSFEITK
ncbi:MAG TPA: hypothetical protein VGZ48_04145 [Candidatus Acidoferrales bacterium]|jgi:hypothetical protein|nr:hypothetical protein [Candidatus Acidoferrales bacterium]